MGDCDLEFWSIVSPLRWEYVACAARRATVWATAPSGPPSDAVLAGFVQALLRLSPDDREAVLALAYGLLEETQPPADQHAKADMLRGLANRIRAQVATR